MRNFVALALFGAAAVAQAADGEQARNLADDDDLDDLDDDDDDDDDFDDDDDDDDDDDAKNAKNTNDDDDDDDDDDDFDDDDDMDLEMPRLSHDFDLKIPDDDKQARHTACARAVGHIDTNDDAVKTALKAIVEKGKENGNKNITPDEAINFLVYSSSIACYYNIDQAEANTVASAAKKNSNSAAEFQPDQLARLFARDVTTPQQWTAEQQKMFDATLKENRYARILSAHMTPGAPLGGSMSPLTQLLYLVGVVLCLAGAGLVAVKKASALPPSDGSRDKSDGNRKQRRQQDKKRK